MLFADADANVWTTVMAVVATVSALGTGFLGYLTARDRMRYDAANAKRDERLDACEADRANLRKRVEEFEAMFRPVRTIQSPAPPTPKEQP